MEVGVYRGEGSIIVVLEKRKKTKLLLRERGFGGIVSYSKL